MSEARWMGWDGGVDLVACTKPGLEAPNLILHVARSVRTPVGVGPAGMVLYQPDPAGPPAVMGFVAADEAHAAYFGPHIFAGTPFEAAPALVATIAVEAGDGEARSKIEVGGHVFETRLSQLGPVEGHDRAPGGATPFDQRVLEAVAGAVEVTVDGEPLELVLPPVGISGGAPAVWAPAGYYSR